MLSYLNIAKPSHTWVFNFADSQIRIYPLEQLILDSFQMLLRSLESPLVGIDFIKAHGYLLL